MQWLDWVMLGLFFLTLVVIGIWSTLSVRQSKDYFVGGGRIPWWVSGISHHVGGYSAVIFTAWAMYAYRDGFSLYIWWALGFAVCCIVGAYLVAPQWSKLRQRLNVQSPTEYLAMRYGIATQQLVVWSGVFLKTLDLAGKTTAMALILKGFAGVPLLYGVLITGVVGLIYNTLGGLFASARNDVFQFLVQLAGGILMFVYVLIYMTANLDGTTYFTMWDKLPDTNSTLFSGECNLFFAIGFWLAIFFGCTGGNWGAGVRFMAAKSAKQATKSAMLSGVLYLIWPLVIFAPMWAAPLVAPIPQTETQTAIAGGTFENPKNLDEAQVERQIQKERETEMKQVYTVMAKKFLPVGFVGIILASMFAASISTIAGDCNAVAGVIARDIAPIFSRKIVNESGQTPMWFARTVAFTFTALTIIIAINSEYFGGVVGLVVKWFSGLLGPISVALVFGLLPQFKKCGSVAALTSTIAGILAFFVVEYGYPMWTAGATAPLSYSLFYPVVVSLVLFCAFAICPFTKPSPRAIEVLERMETAE